MKQKKQFKQAANLRNKLLLSVEDAVLPEGIVLVVLSQAFDNDLCSPRQPTPAVG